MDTKAAKTRSKTENKIPYLSVNTQVSNACSIALYDKMCFQKTGNTFPIFSY